MKILLISGHGAGDVGACGNGYREADLTREVVNMLKEKLSKYAQVDVYNQARNAFDDVNSGNVQVNFANYNYVFEVHFNAFNGSAYGTEIYVTREENATTVEQKIMDKLAQLFTVRGVKRKNFNVINSAKRKGVSSALIEVCFIDNASDIQIYQNNKDQICNLISEGIIEGFGLKEGNYTNNTNNQVKEEFEMAKTYQNGSTKETVYSDSSCTNVIGSLNTWEKCECIGTANGRYIVKYKVDGTNNYKVGFVKYHGGVQ